MSSDDQDKLLDHEYDGIQELDNNLPLWWLWTFFLAIIFSFIYWLHYSFTGDGPTLDEELAANMSRIEEKRNSNQNSAVSAAVDPSVLLAQGTVVYKNYCLSCHSEKGEGGVGPNLTDDFWIHGKGDEATMVTVIENGVLDKGMPPWKEILKPSDIQAVVVFLNSIKGTNVAGKAPQGEKANP